MPSDDRRCSTSHEGDRTAALFADLRTLCVDHRLEALALDVLEAEQLRREGADAERYCSAFVQLANTLSHRVVGLTRETGGLTERMVSASLDVALTASLAARCAHEAARLHSELAAGAR